MGLHRHLDCQLAWASSAAHPAPACRLVTVDLQCRSKEGSAGSQLLALSRAALAHLPRGQPYWWQDQYPVAFKSCAGRLLALQ